MSNIFDSLDKYTNSNKDFSTKSTQRAFFAEEKIKEERRKIFPVDLLEAHDECAVYFHDAGFYYMPSNCLLINLEDMFANGFVLNKILIEAPKSFQTACNLMSQVIFSIGGQVYGGKTVNLSHLAPYLKLTNEKIKRTYPESLREREYKKALRDGIQTINYQVQTLESGADGQAVFCTFFLETHTGDRYINDIVEEVLRQRIIGVKNPNGTRKGQAFPKLVATYDSALTPSSIYDLCIQSVAINMYPDFVLIKNQLKEHEGVYPCMGCRSWLPDYHQGQEGTLKYYGRFNKGVQTLNLVKIATESNTPEEFMENLDKYCDIAKRMGERRMELAKEVDVSEYPLLFQYGAISRFNAGTKLKETNILKDGYSSMSLGYIGLDDLKFFDYIKEALDFDTFKIDIVKYLKAKCEERNSRDNIGWSVYSTPAESLCYKAAQAVNREEKTGRTRLTNSYHTDVTEKQTAFKKISREVPFQYIATGGYISFVELPDMSHNLDGIKSIVAFAEKEGMIYFELNLHLSQCFTCGSHTVEIQEGERTCLDCGEQDKTKLEVTRRTCGYLGTNRWNKGKTEEIAQRELHL